MASNTPPETWKNLFNRTIRPKARLAGYLLAALTVPPSAWAKDYECLVEPRQIVELRAPVEGLIEKIRVDRGDKVGKGQVLIELDAGMDRAKMDLAKYKAGMEGPSKAASHRLEFASSKSKRQHELFQDKFTSANDYEEAKTGENLAEAELIEAHDNKKLAQLEVRENEENLRLKTILSPFNGVVMERLHHPGEVAQPSDKSPVLKLAEIDPLYVEVVLPVTALGKIKVNDVVDISIEPLEKSTFTAAVKVVDPVVDAASSTFGVRLELRNPDGKIPAGVRCQAHMKF